MGRMRRVNVVAGLLVSAVTVLSSGAFVLSAGVPQARASVVNEYQQRVAEQADLKKQLAGVNQDLANQILQLDDLTSNKIPDAQADAQKAEDSASQAKSLAQSTSDRLAAAKKDKANLEQQIRQTGADYDDAKAGVAQQARDSFHGSEASTVMDVVTKSSTTQDFVDKMQSSAAVTRSEANAAADDAVTLNTSQNRKQRLSAIEREIGKLKSQADVQAASAQQAYDAASAKQASLQALRDQSAAARERLESQKSQLTSASARQAADITILGAKIDQMNQSVAPQYTTVNAHSGGAQQVSTGKAPAQVAPAPSAPSAGYAGHPSGDSGQGYSSYPGRNCTLWAYIRRHQLGLPVGDYFGNGAQWADSARRKGYSVDRTPREVGDIVVFAAGQSVGGHWTADSTCGHVAIVEGIFSNSIVISEGGKGFATFPARETLTGNLGAYEYIHR